MPIIKVLSTFVIMHELCHRQDRRKISKHYSKTLTLDRLWIGLFIGFTLLGCNRDPTRAPLVEISWQHIEVPAFSSLKILPTRGIAATNGSDKSSYISVDLGATWTEMGYRPHAVTQTGVIYSISMNDSTGIAGLVRLDPESEQWTYVAAMPYTRISIRYANDDGLLQILGWGLPFSSDGGYNWRTSPTAPSTVYGLYRQCIGVDVQGGNGEKRLILLTNGFGIYTKDGPNHPWKSRTDHISPRLTLNSIVESPNNVLYAIGNLSEKVDGRFIYRGSIVYSADAGESWRRIIYEEFERFDGITVNRYGHLYAIIDKKVFRSANRGKSWENIHANLPSEVGRFISILMDDEGYLWVVHRVSYQPRKLFRTVDPTVLY